MDEAQHHQQIADMMATDNFEGLGHKVQELFRLPQALCKTRGNCCRVATYKGTLSAEEIKTLADSQEEDSANAREFLTLFESYTTQDDAREVAPLFVEQVRGGFKNGNPDAITFFRCRFLADDGRCQIHEDRPTGCRIYPFPHEKTIYHPGCGFAPTGIARWQAIQDITGFFEKRFQEMESQTASLEAQKEAFLEDAGDLLDISEFESPEFGPPEN